MANSKLMKFIVFFYIKPILYGHECKDNMNKKTFLYYNITYYSSRIYILTSQHVGSRKLFSRQPVTRGFQNNRSDESFHTSFLARIAKI